MFSQKKYIIIRLGAAFLQKQSSLNSVLLCVKVAATDIKYFAGNKFFRSLVHKKNFSLIWQVVLKLGYIFCQESLNELWEKILQATIITGEFVNKTKSNSHCLMAFGKCFSLIKI